MKFIFQKMKEKYAVIDIRAIIKAFFGAAIVSFLSYLILINRIQPYDDIVMGNLTFDGVYKNVDFYTFYIFLISYFIFYFFTQKNDILLKTRDEYKFDRCFYQKIFGLFTIIIFILIKQKNFSSFELFFLALALFTIFVYKRKGLDTELIIKAILLSVYIYLTFSGFIALAFYLYPVFATKIKYVVLFVMFTVIVVMAIYVHKVILKNRETKIVDALLYLSQLFVPIILLGIVNTQFIYHGENYDVRYYKNLAEIIKYMILFLIFANILHGLFSLRRKRRSSKVLVSTVISVASVLLWPTYYDLIINQDQFHTGETAIVWDQVVKHGQEWGSEFISVLQGLGFLQSAINEKLFGGTFATYVQSNSVMLLFAAIITLIALYFVIDDKAIILLFISILPFLISNRTYLIVPTFVLLLIPKFVKNSILWTYMYAVTCIVHIWYQPTYGGAISAALLLAFIYIWYQDFKEEKYQLSNKKDLTKLSVFVTSLIIIFICCIPLLKDVMHFLEINAQSTVLANGISLKQALLNDPLNFTGIRLLDKIILFTFKYIVGILSIVINVHIYFAYVRNEEDKVRRIQGFIITICSSLSFILLIPATLTRIDGGTISRVGCISAIYFGCLLLILMYLYRNRVEKKLKVFLITLCVCNCISWVYVPFFQIHDKVSATVQIPDDAIHVTVEQSGLSKLGDTFLVDKMYLHEAMCIKEICDTLLDEKQTYYDFADKSIYYSYSAKKVPGKFAAPLISATRSTQTETLEELKNNDVPIIFINAPKRFMGGTESLRSYRIYKYFMLQDYRYLNYKGCNFLIRGDIDTTPIKDSIIVPNIPQMATELNIMINPIDFSQEFLLELNANNKASNNDMEDIGEEFKVTGIDPFVVYNLPEEIKLNEISFLEINLTEKPKADIVGQIFVKTDVREYNEKNSYIFEISSDKIVIPLFEVGGIFLDEQLQNLRLDFDLVSFGDMIGVKNIKFYKINTNKIQEIKDFYEEQYEKQYEEQHIKFGDKKINKLFSQRDLMELPHQWGHSWKLLSNMFENTFSRELDEDLSKNNIFISDIGLRGKEVEFLKISISKVEEKKIPITVTVNGILRNGNSFSQVFLMSGYEDDLLVPIGSSPNCLRAESIDSIEISAGREIKETIIDKIELYQLND